MRRTYIAVKGDSNEYILYGEHIHGGAKHFFRGTEVGPRQNSQTSQTGHTGHTGQTSALQNKCVKNSQNSQTGQTGHTGETSALQNN